MTSFALKIIAVLSMLLDHLFQSDLLGQKQLMDWFGLSMASSYRLVMIVEPLGRLAFPIYAFFIAEGCRRTRSQARYILRLLLFGVISEFPYDVAFNPVGQPWYGAFTPFSHLNVFFTLALGAAGIALYERLRGAGKAWYLACLPAVACAVIAELLRADYLIFGPMMIYAAYFPSSKGRRLAAMAGVNALIYLGYYTVWFAYWDISAPIYLAASWAALGLLAFYNGRRGPKLKWLFYAVYPVHLALYMLLKLAL
ncbi:MAG: hypothetical protein IJ048_06870 [Clostridia bacterium]|nr:hypothetical protein [Clostridia bacterium]